jgi:uncharacterized membrane protein
MRRTSSKPWLHRFSRPLLGAIATTGAINTAYLTYLRFTSTSCPTETCAVLASRYATVFGQPLSLFGLLAYLGIAVLALSPLLINPDTQKSLRKKLEDQTWLALFAGATAMLMFSLYLMNVMFSEFVFGGAKLGAGGICPFCLFSAILATAMFVIVLIGREWDERGPLFSIGAIVTTLTLVGSLAIYAPSNAVTAQAGQIADTQGKVVFTYDSTSGAAETQLAKHLQSTGAVMYGSYRCSHCCEQKARFGAEAVAAMPYTECSMGGKDAKPEVCEAELAKASEQTKQPGGFPTWKVNGKYFAGTKSLQDLATASEYKGPQDFKNNTATCTAK